MSFRNYLTWTFFAILFFWGPIHPLGTPDLWPRISYLIILPLIAWLLIAWVWNKWTPSKRFEIILNRILSGMICIILISLAIGDLTAKNHFENTQTIRTRDGYEDVGDYIAIPGPDYGSALITTLISFVVFWFGVLGKGKDSSRN